jgi:hypothetical protein
MRLHIPYTATALGFALVAVAPVAHAQTVITREIADQPVETVITQRPSGTVVTEQPLATVPGATVLSQPVQTVQTTETIRTVRPAPPAARRQIVTTKTITRQRIVPTQTVAQTVTTVPPPLYDDAAPAPFATNPNYSPPLYDEVVQAPPASSMPVAADTYSTPLIYRYVYEPDRILVIDPHTNIAVQALPR